MSKLKHTPREVFEKTTQKKAFHVESLLPNIAYIEWLEKIHEEMLEVLIRITTRLKKYHNEQKEPEVLELMDILDAENIIEKATGIDPEMKIEEVIK